MTFRFDKNSGKNRFPWFISEVTIAAIRVVGEKNRYKTETYVLIKLYIVQYTSTNKNAIDI